MLRQIISTSLVPSFWCYLAVQWLFIYNYQIIGLLKLNVYVLSEENKEQKASLHTITFSIGDALKEDRSKRITL